MILIQTLLALANATAIAFSTKTRHSAARENAQLSTNAILEETLISKKIAKLTQSALYSTKTTNTAVKTCVCLNLVIPLLLDVFPTLNAKLMRLVVMGSAQLLAIPLIDALLIPNVSLLALAMIIAATEHAKMYHVIQLEGALLIQIAATEKVAAMELALFLLAIPLTGATLIQIVS